MTQVLNQFSQTAEKGQLDLRFGHIGNVVQCLAYEALVPGQAVKLVDDAKGLPQVAVATDTDEPFGYVVYSLKKAPAAGDIVEIALAGSVMFMTAGAAIARGAYVMHVAATGKVITATGTTKYISGRAFDKAASDGDLVRVYLTTFEQKQQPSA